MNQSRAKIKPQPLRRKSTVDRDPRKKKKDEEKTPWKRFLITIGVILVLIVGFYIVQYAQVESIKKSLDSQITDAQNSSARDSISLQKTLADVRANYPDADGFSADSVFTSPQMVNRLNDRTESILQGGEDGIKDMHAHTPLLFITDIIIPGLQSSTDDYYRNALKTHVSSQEFKDFNNLKLKVDDLMAGVNYCRDIPTNLNYGYTDPIPSADVKAARVALIQEAARRHLCPEKP